MFSIESLRNVQKASVTGMAKFYKYYYDIVIQDIIVWYAKKLRK